MVKKLRQEKQDNRLKELTCELIETIKKERNNQFGQFKKVNSNLYEVKVKFNSKYISKQEYNQLLGLHKFMQNNPKLTESDIRNMLYRKSVTFAFLIECDRKIDDFLSEVKRHGAYYMAEYIAGRNGGLENWANKNSLR